MTKEKLVKKKRRKRCNHCHELKEDVRYRTDPYAEEICGVERWENICDECYSDSLMDI